MVGKDEKDMARNEGESWEQSDWFHYIDENGKDAFELRNVELSVKDNGIEICGNGKKVFKELQKSLEDAASYGFDEVTKGWSITIDGYKDE